LFVYLFRHLALYVLFIYSLSLFAGVYVSWKEKTGSSRLCDTLCVFFFIQGQPGLAYSPGLDGSDSTIGKRSVFRAGSWLNRFGLKGKTQKYSGKVKLEEES
jgi:hypothetical protein